MPTQLTPPYWTGGPPYPSYATDNGKFGLSVLDWFAGHAIAGLMGSPLIDRAFFDQFTFPESSSLAVSKEGASASQQEQHAVIEVMTEWDWRISEVMPPPNGKIGSFNGAWDTTVTGLYITTMDNHNIDRSAILAAIQVNDVIRIQRATDSTIFSQWVVNGAVTTAATDNYFNVPVALSEVSGTASATTMTVVIVGESAPTTPLPPATDELAMIAYAIAGQMAELRKNLPIEPKPVPPPVETDAPSVVRMVDRGLQPPRKLSQNEIDQRLNPLTNEVPPAP